MTIFGGCNDGTMDVPNDVWVLKHANGLDGQPDWSQLAPAGTPPAPRCGAVATYSARSNPASSVMTIYGGCCPSLGDVWVLNGANGVIGTPAWQQLAQSTPAPGPHETRAFGYDADMNLLMFFGGYSYPGPVYYDDVWMLKDANDVGGVPTWSNTVASNSPGSPPAGSGSGGGYDPMSKRLMLMQDPANLWVMTTRNGIDVSCSAPVPTSGELSKMQRAGIQYAVVKAPQYDSGECPSAQIMTAQNQLAAFATQFKTAAYCFLDFSVAKSGTLQAERCLANIEPNITAGEVSFLAVDVEGGRTLSQSDAGVILQEAITAIEAKALQPAIYTRRSDWITIIGSANTSFGAYPLWLASGGVPSLTPWPSTFGGWTTLSGKQYALGVPLAGISPVDYDVFDPVLFP